MALRAAGVGLRWRARCTFRTEMRLCFILIPCADRKVSSSGHDDEPMTHHHQIEDSNRRVPMKVKHKKILVTKQVGHCRCPVPHPNGEHCSRLPPKKIYTPYQALVSNPTKETNRWKRGKEEEEDEMTRGVVVHGGGGSRRRRLFFIRLDSFVRCTHSVALIRLCSRCVAPYQLISCLCFL